MIILFKILDEGSCSTDLVLNELEGGMEIVNKSISCGSIYNFFPFLPLLVKKHFEIHEIFLCLGCFLFQNAVVVTTWKLASSTERLDFQWDRADVECFYQGGSSV